MTDNTTLDAAIFAGQKVLGDMRRRGEQTNSVEAERTYARALIAKLIDGMERHEGFNGFWYDGYRAALDDLQKISGAGSRL